ncbi:MAG: HAD family hydrolase [Nitrospinota bacterium]|nr:MAG: HAD family hydrolase [Nitrospinota bacterium]
MRLPIRVVLFDVYGTLFISAAGDIGTAQERNNAEAFQVALRASGFCPLRDGTGEWGMRLLDRTIRAVHARQRQEGISYPEIEIRQIWEQVLSLLQQEGWIQGDIGPEAVMRLAVEYECRVNPVWPMPGLQGTLQGLRERGIVLGIISNAQFFTPLLFPALLNRELNHLGFAPHLCTWSYLAREAKPSSRLFSPVLTRLERDGISPAQTLYVGNDCLNDMWPAAMLGWKTALFAGDRRSLRLREGEPRCAGVTPDLVVTDLRQLLSVPD